LEGRTVQRDTRSGNDPQKAGKYENRTEGGTTTPTILPWAEKKGSQPRRRKNVSKEKKPGLKKRESTKEGKKKENLRVLIAHGDDRGRSKQEKDLTTHVRAIRETQQKPGKSRLQRGGHGKNNGRRKRTRLGSDDGSNVTKNMPMDG